jgi:hypothetical protein
MHRVSSFCGRADSLELAIDDATEQADEWLKSLSLSWRLSVVSMSTQCFPSENIFDVYIITLVVKCEIKI